MGHVGVRFDYGYNGVCWLVREACSGNSAQPFENRFSNVFGGNESGFSNEVTAIPAPPALAVPAYTYEWEYDACGNRTAKRCLGGQAIFGTSTYGYDDENRLTWEETELGRINYAYDANGNTTTKTKQWNGQVERYYYDFANRMNSYRNAAGQTWSYVFAPGGERFAKLNPDGSEEWFAYDGPDVVTDYARASSGVPMTWTSSYVQGLGIDSKIARLTTVSGTPSALYYVGDYLNSVHMLVGQNQQVINTNVTSAWGEEIVSSQSLPERYGFTQREDDRESSLQFSRQRIYDPSLGRFTSEDPIIGSRFFSHYVYVLNNPGTFSDPTGREAKGKFTLSFDDGPTYGDIHDIVVATFGQAKRLGFFFIGSKIDEEVEKLVKEAEDAEKKLRGKEEEKKGEWWDKSLVRLAYAKGHAIGYHSYDHDGWGSFCGDKDKIRIDHHKWIDAIGPLQVMRKEKIWRAPVFNIGKGKEALGTEYKHMGTDVAGSDLNEDFQEGVLNRVKSWLEFYVKDKENPIKRPDLHIALHEVTKTRRGLPELKKLMDEWGYELEDFDSTKIPEDIMWWK